MSTINDLQAVAAEIVLQERVTTTEFRVLEIHESVPQRFVRAEIELGPFVTSESGPGGQTETRGSRRMGVDVWNGVEYDTIRDTWTNADLLLAIKSKI